LVGKVKIIVEDFKYLRRVPAYNTKAGRRRHGENPRNRENNFFLEFETSSTDRMQFNITPPKKKAYIPTRRGQL
jgi:hypothetical protein